MSNKYQNSVRIELDKAIRDIYSGEYTTPIAMRDIVWAAISGRPEFLMEIMKGNADSLLTAYMAKMVPPIESDTASARERERIEYRKAMGEVYKKDKLRIEADKAANPGLYDGSAIREAIEEIKVSAIEEYKSSILAKLIINGRPFGEVSPREAFAWVDSQKQKSDFMEAILSGVSLYDNRLIKDIITPSEANKAWAQSGGRPIV